jgi:tellurite resistance protein TehA-like permease
MTIRVYMKAPMESAPGANARCRDARSGHFTITQGRIPMENVVAIAQVIIALSVLFVWIVRYPHVEKEFREYALPDVVRNLVGATKISASALLLAGLWYPGLVFPSAALMTFLLVCAQLFHFKARHPIVKFVPSFVLMILSLFVAVSTRGSLA